MLPCTYKGACRGTFCGASRATFSGGCPHPLKGCPEVRRCDNWEKENERKGEKKEREEEEGKSSFLMKEGRMVVPGPIGSPASRRFWVRYDPAPAPRDP